MDNGNEINIDPEAIVRFVFNLTVFIGVIYITAHPYEVGQWIGMLMEGVRSVSQGR